MMVSRRSTRELPENNLRTLTKIHLYHTLDSMPTLVGVGSSVKKNSSEAVKEAFEGATNPLQGNPPSFLMLLASPTVYDQEELIRFLGKTAPQATRIGCSTSGEITSVSGSTDNSLALMAIYSDNIKFVAGVGNNIKADPRKSGQELAEDIRRKGGGTPQTGLILPDGLAGNGADIVRGILDVYGLDFRLAGGSAGDDFQFKKTYEYAGDQLLSGSVIGVGLYGDFSFGIGVRHGWVPIGTPRIATKSHSNILEELDGRPAIEIYEDYFGKDQTLISHKEPLAKFAITYPLGIIAPNKDGYLIRDPLTVDENGAITCAAEIPEGSEVYLMIGSREEAIDAAEDAAQKAIDQVEGKTIKAAFLFNCIARKKLLMTKKQEEIDRIRKILGPDVPLIGFYTYGEQAPLGGEVITCSFHNETDVIFVLAQ